MRVARSNMIEHSAAERSTPECCQNKPPDRATALAKRFMRRVSKFYDQYILKNIDYKHEKKKINTLPCLDTHTGRSKNSIWNRIPNGVPNGIPIGHPNPASSVIAAAILAIIWRQTTRLLVLGTESRSKSRTMNRTMTHSLWVAMLLKFF